MIDAQRFRASRPRSGLAIEKTDDAELARQEGGFIDHEGVLAADNDQVVNRDSLHAHPIIAAAPWHFKPPDLAEKREN